MPEIKVLILLPGLRRCGPVLGGVALAKQLDRIKCSVIVGHLGKTASEYSAVLDILKKSDIRVESLGLPGWTGLLEMKNTRKFIEKENIDILTSYGLRPDIVNALTENSCVSVSSVRGFIRNEYKMKYGRLAARIISFFHIKALKRMESVIAMTDTMKADLQREGILNKKIALIPNFIDMEEIHPLKTEERMVIRTGDDADEINIGFIGNFNRIKRVDWIVRAAGEIIRQNPELSLKIHLAGDGPLRKSVLKSVAEDNLNSDVKYYGHVDDVYKLIKKMDLIVLASFFEGTPRVFMEAMLLGKTCLGPDIAGVKGLIIDKVTGYLFNPDSYGDFLKKLRAIVKKKSFLAPEVVTDHIRNNFDAKSGAEKTLKLYQRLLSEKRLGTNPE